MQAQTHNDVQSRAEPPVRVDGGVRRDAARAVRAGLVAGLGFGATLLALELLTGTSSLLSLFQDRLISLLPGRVSSRLIDRFQFAAKPLALIGLVAAMAVGTALLALLLRWLARNRATGWNRPLGQAIVLAVLVWLLPEIALLPGAERGSPATWLSQAVIAGVAAAVAGLLYGISCSAYATDPQTSLEFAAGTAAHVSRRKLLAGAVGWGAAGVTVALVAKTIGDIGERGSPVTARPAGQDTGGPDANSSTSGGFNPPAGVSAEITPTDRFYVVSKNLVDPTVSASGWSLELKGLIDRPMRLSYSDLLAMPATDVFATLECVSNSVGGDLISNTRWTGVPLAGLLSRAGLHPDAEWIIFGASDGYVEGLPVELASRSTTLLAHSMNGAPLPSKHGFPIRVLTPGNYGMRNPKWLTTIQASKQPPSGYWEKQGWNVESGIKTMARFDTRPRQAAIGSEVELGGIAFAGDRGITRVDLSTDGGETWTAAEMSRPLSKATWVLWSKRWTPERAGRAVLMVRSIDGDGHAQIGDRHEPFPAGATGYDTIQVSVGT